MINSTTTRLSIALATILFMMVGCSKKDNTSCGTPTGLSVTNYTNSSVKLNWGAVSGATHYNIQYQLVGTGSWINTSADTATSFTLTGLGAGGRYAWQVEATCPSGTSAFSAADSFNVNISTTPNLVFQFYFDSTQVRLDNFGNPATMPSGHAGISPKFNVMSAHYIELAQTSSTQLGQGAVLFKAAETTIGGSDAIVFDSAKFAGQGQIFFTMPLSQVPTGSYTWLRVSLAYQNYTVNMLVNVPPYVTNQVVPGTIASFVGFNTYLTNYKIKDSTVTVNTNKKQGYWGFETSYLTFGEVDTGSAAVTTVPNPISTTSPIPAGSCVVTGQFASPLVIANGATHDVVIKVSLSVNKSFEFIDTNGNGQWDVSSTGAEQIVDMGIRGLIPIVE